MRTHVMLSRREVLRALGAGGAAGWVAGRPGVAGAEPPPETTRVRLSHRVTMCEAAQYAAEDLLRTEGFTEIEYVRKRKNSSAEDDLAAGEIDISTLFGMSLITRIDAGAPIVFLAGVHVGCVDLFVGPRVRTARDLRGKRVAIIDGLGGPTHLILATIMAQVGIDPRTEVTWVEVPFTQWERDLVDGKVDAFLSWPPYAQALKARKVGRVILSTVADRPWSQYFCCLVVANREFVRRHPVATKRALRAILKSSEICAQEPERVARLLMDRGLVERSDYAVQAMKEVAFGRWRDYDPEDAVRFYALRLREAGMVKSTPQQIIARATDWRFVNELKKELKA